MFGLNGVTPNLNEDLIFPKTKQFITLKEDELVISDTRRVFINLDFTPAEEEKVIWDGYSINLKRFTLDKEAMTIYQQGGSSVLQLNSISVDRESSIYSASFSGIIDPGLPLVVNGFILNKWRLISTGESSSFYVDDKPLNVIKREGSLMYTRMPVSKNSILTCEGISVDFRLRERALPQTVMHEGNILEVQVEDKQVKLYGETKDMKNGDKVTDCNNGLMECAITIEREAIDPYTVWIELIDDEEDSDDDGSIVLNSKIDYFFSEDVSELEESQDIPLKIRRKFRIEPGRRKEERLLKLRRMDNRPLSYEDLPDELCVPVNTYQLEMQRQANRSIKERPLVEHKYLLALTERKIDNTPWQSFRPYEPECWYVLKDGNRDGTENQRNFVRKAIATEDFVLLEGPPGSGRQLLYWNL